MYFVVSGILVLFGLMLGGAAIENFNPEDLTNTYTVRSLIGYALFMGGAAVAFVGAWRRRE